MTGRQEKGEASALLRHPDNYLAKLSKRVTLNYNNFPKGTIVEIEPPVNRDFSVAHQRDSGIIFMIAQDEYEIIEEPITLKLFYMQNYGKEYAYWQEL